MTHYGLIGHPLTHSFSQKYFTEKFNREGIADTQYNLYDMPDIAALPALLATPGLRGLNVTIPHKTNVLPYLDRLDASAEKVGAVNVIRLEADGTKTGFNSDYYGFRQSLEEAKCEWRKAKGEGLDAHAHSHSAFHISPLALILGTGGASKAVVAALRDMGITYRMVSRTPGPDGLAYADVPSVITDCQLIVNCSPVGTYPNVTAAPDLPYHLLTPNHFLYDLVYNPAETEFMRRGAAQGAQVLNGYRMLVLQAEKAWEIWNSMQ
jgi:shikimate dehydrogenase